jgi:hypothetical protein
VRTGSSPPKQPESSEATQATAPSWRDWHEALAVVAHRPHLVKTIGIALFVGTVLFAINQLDVVLRHDATSLTYLKIALTYLVPFCVSNYGLLVATRRAAPGKGAAR